MIVAVCIACGAKKPSGAFASCDSCKSTPETENELARSLALSRYLCSEAQLETYAREIRSHLKLSMSENLLNQAHKALKDPQLLAILGVHPQSVREESHTQPTPRVAESAPRSVSSSSTHRHQRSLYQSQLQQNPFALLGVTVRDDRRHIVALAEEKSLELDHEACQKARSDLTSPRIRLSVEMAWLPGVPPEKTWQLMSVLYMDPMSIRRESGLPTLAHLNLLAAAFEAVDGNDSPDDVADFIQEMAYMADDLSTEQVLRDINEDRSVSGFPEVRGIDQVEAELSERKRYYCNAIMDALDRFPSALLVDAMTAAVDGITCGGEDHAPELIDDLVDSYAVKTQGFLQKESESVEKLIKTARDSASRSGENVVKPIVDKLVAVTRNWDKIAQPIQLSAKARGTDHEPSRDIAHSIRNLAVHLFNEYDMLTQSQRLTELVQELFGELPEVVELVDKDAETLADIFQNRKATEAQKDEWARDITYQAEVGVIFKNILSISPDGVAWKNQRFPLDAVTCVRWGAVRRSISGIPTGTTYTLAFGDDRSEAVVELRKKSTYATFVEKLWKAVAIRLVAELLETLQVGNEVRFGDATLRDDSVTLIKHKFFWANKPIRCSWGQVHFWDADGAFYIGAKDDKKTYVGLSYIDDANTHVLEQAIRMAFKKPGMRKLSDVFR